jgi:hypothetical protein
MKTSNAILATLLFSMLAASGCAVVSPAVGEHEEEINPAVGNQEDDGAYRRRIELWDFMGDSD